MTASVAGVILLISPKAQGKAKRWTRWCSSPDGALVPLVGGEWAEVKTLVIGEVEADEQQTGEVHTSKLSYFSRLADAETFGELAVVETERRGVVQAKQVCAVQNGALWLQGFVDLHRPTAVRILDFPHAAQYLADSEQALRSVGADLPADWLSTQLHQLKHEGPTAVLKEVRTWQATHAEVEGLAEKLAYLEKREAHMQYPSYWEQGWPIGSGIVESGNKVVMQARLKGAGMHWARPHVNQMLALRTAECNQRWEEAWQQSTDHRRSQRMQRRLNRQQHRYQQLLRAMQCFGLLLCLRTRKPTLSKPTLSKSTLSPSAPQHAVPVRPAPNHPWRRRFLAKK